LQKNRSLRILAEEGNRYSMSFKLTDYLLLVIYLIAVSSLPYKAIAAELNVSTETVTPTQTVAPASQTLPPQETTTIPPATPISTVQTTAAVAPPVGAVTAPELKTCAVEIREQLRTHGYRLAVQGDVRAAMAAAGVQGKPTTVQLKQTAESVGAELVFVSVISENEIGQMYFETAAFNLKTGGSRAVRAKLPSRGAAPYRSEHFVPAVTACVARLLDQNPDPIHGPFPQTIEIDSKRLIRIGKPTTAASPASAVTSAKAPQPVAKIDQGKPQPKVAEGEEEGEKKKKPYDWKKWDHAGLFGELGFVFSWCTQEGMCAGTTRGYAGRIRFGVRIASYVALSFSAVGADHQMPITTDANVFLNVEKAFVFGAIFGGLRVHPIRRFPVDPYVGVDFGYSWLLYASNTVVAADPNIPSSIAGQLGSLMTMRRETIYLKGFTAAPEFGVNFFVAPPLAFGIHVQWLLPHWKDVCSRVYNPTIQGLRSAAQVCTTLDKVPSSQTMDERAAEVLSKKDNLPRFVTLELDLVFVFK
jgi:hypothetical protein